MRALSQIRVGPTVWTYILTYTSWRIRSPAGPTAYHADLLWPCCIHHISSLGPPVAVPPSDVLGQCIPRTSRVLASLGFTAGPGERSRSKSSFVTSHVSFTQEVHFRTWYAPPGFYPLWLTGSFFVFFLFQGSNTPTSLEGAWISITSDFRWKPIIPDKCTNDGYPSPSCLNWNWSPVGIDR